MNRRNALLGLGAIVTGGGAAFGSGAFSQVEADRTVTVNTAGDAGAFLSLSPTAENSGYVDQTAGTLELSLDGSTSNVSGDGFNYDAVSYIEPLFEITNNGSGEVGIRIGTTPNTNNNVSITSSTVDGTTASSFAYTDTDTINMVFYAAGTGPGTTRFTDGSLDASVSNSIVMDSFGASDTVNLDIGQGNTVEIGFVLDTVGVDSTNIGSTAELLGEIEIVADMNQS